MKILQLCFVNNLWPENYEVVSIDIKTGQNILDLPLNFGQGFDFIVAAPPCDQFTKANALNWEKNPNYFVNVANHCFEICVNSGAYWILENPPGRITKFMPALKKFRICTWHGTLTNKEYVVYSNMLLLKYSCNRYGKPGAITNFSKVKREAWQTDFFDYIHKNMLIWQTKL